MNVDKEQQLGTFLQFTAEGLDISADLDQELTERYEDLGEWLKRDNTDRFSTDSDVYTQGSRRLGTLVRPVKAEDECDIDLVYVRHLSRTSITQKDLKQQIGEQLRRYIKHVRETDGEIIKLEEKQRCWQLRFGNRFHMDVLPALPDDQAAKNRLIYPEHGIIITDKDLSQWQSSNPKGYSEWFNLHMVTMLTESRRMMAKAASVDVEDVPEHTVKTPLHRVVQLLKRHRDLRYEKNPDDKPISIIITTLAAKAYENQADIYEAMTSIVKKMAALIEFRNGRYWIPNPVAPNENFADKWAEHPQRANRFFEWLEQVQSDIDRAKSSTGIQKVASVLGESFGKEVADGAAKRFGSSMMEARDSRQLKATVGSATLGTAGSISVVPHTFYGNIH